MTWKEKGESQKNQNHPMIEILNQQKRYKLDTRKYKNLLEKLIKFYDKQKVEVTLAFVNNKAIRDLNRRFLKKDTPTDVLSFPIRERNADGKYYLGDIIVSVPQAAKQASSKAHILDRELELLIIHGFLHLHGFEHFKGLEKEEKNLRKLLLESNNGN